jgi:hypothetical protein
MVALLDGSRTRFCIRNGAKKGRKIVKIVVSGLTLVHRICISNGGRRLFLELINNLESRIAVQKPDVV